MTMEQFLLVRADEDRFKDDDLPINIVEHDGRVVSISRAMDDESKAFYNQFVMKAVAHPTVRELSHDATDEMWKVILELNLYENPTNQYHSDFMPG